MAHAEAQEGSVVETIQSLIVAFVLAMTFRGFVTEGFVIPTGSMAPTLLGQHKSLRSEQTGWTFPAGVDARARPVSLTTVPDPMLGPEFTGTGSASRSTRTRMGDRILVLKGLYRFSEPSRYDVVVFKNPTNPNGEDGNYIKRLIGLPDESIWLVDGDVFAAPAAEWENLESYTVQRKPEHVQRAVWRPVFDADYYPRRPDMLDVSYHGPPWQGDGWETRARAGFRCEAATPTTLEWDPHIRTIDDWVPYNMLVQRAPRRRLVPVSDVRVAAAIVPDAEGLETVFRLDVRGHQMEFSLAAGQARVRMRSAAWGEEHPDQGWTGPAPVAFDGFRPGRPTNVEFWHVDQSLSIYVDGERVVEHLYDWRPAARLEHATGRDGDVAELASRPPSAGPSLRWRFSGSPLTLHRVRVDRDLNYRGDRLDRRTALRNPTAPGFDDRVRHGQFAFGTHPENLAVLGPAHFFMAGDNSPASSDSRLWGNPHPTVATQIDDSPFVVHRSLLLGKAWVVYFPAPYAMTDNGRAFIPDFGKLRFIR